MSDTPPEPLFSIQDEIGAHDHFYRIFGEAMAAWAQMEHALLAWFLSATGLREDIGRAIFFSAKSFSGRRDMLADVIVHSPFDEDVRSFLKAVLKKTRQYSEFRNKIAHGQPVFNIGKNSPTYLQFVIVEGNTNNEETVANGITIKQLGIGIRNLNELRRLSWDVHPDYRRAHMPSVPECRLAVLRLPNQAHSTEAAQIRE